MTQLSLKLHFGATLHRRAVSEQKKGPIWLLFSEVELFFHKHNYEEKNCSPPQKRADFQTSQVVIWIRD